MTQGATLSSQLATNRNFLEANNSTPKFSHECLGCIGCLNDDFLTNLSFCSQQKSPIPAEGPLKHHGFLIHCNIVKPSCLWLYAGSILSPEPQYQPLRCELSHICSSQGQDYFMERFLLMGLGSPPASIELRPMRHFTM